MIAYGHARLAGRCSNGGELDGGRRVHLVEAFEHGHAERALCGATYGRLSAGWAPSSGPASCGRCVDRWVKRHARGEASLA